jgi:hypothetical protein
MQNQTFVDKILRFQLRSLPLPYTRPSIEIFTVLRIQIRDPGWVESQHPDPESGMINPDHIF